MSLATVARVAADEPDDRDREHEDGEEREEPAHADRRGQVRAPLRPEPALDRSTATSIHG